MITFGIIIGSVSIALIAGDAAWNLVGKRAELKRLRNANGKLAQENMALRNANELLEARLSARQCTRDLIKDIQIDDLKQEVRNLEARLEAKEQLLRQKWEVACERTDNG